MRSGGYAHNAEMRTVSSLVACPWDVEYFCMVLMLLFLEFRQVARAIRVVGESATGVCVAGARENSPLSGPPRNAEGVRHGRV